MHENIGRTGDRSTGRNKEQETRYRTVLRTEEEVQCKILRETGDSFRGRNKEQETSKELRTEDEVQCVKV
jgi:hypothetical protein